MLCTQAQGKAAYKLQMLLYVALYVLYVASWTCVSTQSRVGGVPPTLIPTLYSTSMWQHYNNTCPHVNLLTENNNHYSTINMPLFVNGCFQQVQVCIYVVNAAKIVPKVFLCYSINIQLTCQQLNKIVPCNFSRCIQQRDLSTKLS